VQHAAAAVLKTFFYKVMELNADNAAVYNMLNGNCSLYNSISYDLLIFLNVFQDTLPQ
jgi:hypothetical protein